MAIGGDGGWDAVGGEAPVDEAAALGDEGIVGAAGDEGELLGVVGGYHGEEGAAVDAVDVHAVVPVAECQDVVARRYPCRECEVGEAGGDDVGHDGGCGEVEDADGGRVVVSPEVEVAAGVVVGEKLPVAAEGAFISGVDFVEADPWCAAGEVNDEVVAVFADGIYGCAVGRGEEVVAGYVGAGVGDGCVADEDAAAVVPVVGGVEAQALAEEDGAAGVAWEVVGAEDELLLKGAVGDVPACDDAVAAEDGGEGAVGR